MPPSISILGAGWLGLPLGAYLSQLNRKVYGSTTNPEKFSALRASSLHPVLLDIGSGDLLPEHDFWKSEVLVITIPPSSAVKGARKSTHAPVGIYRDRLARAIDMAKQKGVERIIYTSSTSVYGNLTGRIDERIAPQPHTTSAQMVLQAENLVLTRFGKDVTILRLGGLVGGDREPSRYLAGRKGLKNGGAPVNMVHREDVVRALTALIEQPGPHRIYNVVADTHPTRAAYHRARALRLGLEAPSFDSPPEPNGKQISNERLTSEFGFQFLHPDPIHFP